MLSQIISHTPVWVWFLLAGLLWLGANQMFTRTVTLRRVTLLPITMTGLSLFGTASVFGSIPLAIPVWAAAAAITAALVLQRPLPAGVSYDSWTGRFTLPGSAIPLLLIVGIFAVKYAVGVSLGMHAELARDLTFALTVSLLYGVFSGVFIARSARLWKLARASDSLPASAV